MPPDPDAPLRRSREGDAHLDAGRADDAEAAYREAVTLDPKCGDSWRGLGLLAQRRNRPAEAVEYHRKAAAARPDWPEAFNDLGIALAQSGNWGEARTAFETAARLRPAHAGTVFNLANVLRRLGDPDAAEAALRKAVCLAPTDPDHHAHLARLLAARGRVAEAVVGFGHAVRFAPPRADLHRELAFLLTQNGREAEAVAPFREALKANPDDAAVLAELGWAVAKFADDDEGLALLARAVELDPSKADAAANRGALLSDRGRADESRAAYRQAVAARPADPRLKLAGACVLPVVYESAEQVSAERAALRDRLDKLLAAGVRVDPTAAPLPTLFYLAYQGGNDREFHERFGRIADGPRRVALPPPAPPKRDRVRIGFLSRYLSAHTMGAQNAALIAGLDRRRFEVVVLNAGPADDPVAKAIRRSADHAVSLPLQLEPALRAVADLKLDLLYFPDVGMDPFTLAVACSRMAPVQVACWGHPVTTGLPAIDAYVSARDLETDPAAHYSERTVVTTTQLNLVLDPPPPPGPVPREAFGLPATGRLYGCPQSTFKFHPDFDAVLGGVLRADPGGRVVLLKAKTANWDTLLKARIDRTLADVKDRILWVPRTNRGGFSGLLAVCDVLLDPFPFGGGQTSIEAFGVGTPVVTLPTPFLRGRLTFAMVNQIGLASELVADSVPDFVAKAVRIATDPAHRAEVRRKVSDAAPRLFHNAAVLTEIGRELLKLAGRDPG